ncbi:MULTISPECIES: hypothetical protein [Stenotrophomonas]|uniref:Uncharacterized protein n=1 Tax=Stenotrophomonas maltophilia TaxID=40324 RepID=A0A431ULC4_STEMA|nr:hypothetical protein [Stenotrophomonas maltophilia]RTQ90501.1 hypothetical protein EKL94_06170 [Stenotrophomonas maltophilia]
MNYWIAALFEVGDKLSEAAFVQTLAGGLISALAASRAVDRQLRAEQKAREDADAQQIANLKSAVRMELKSVRDQHILAVGHIMSPPDAARSAILAHYPISSEYFALYSANAGSIGRVSPEAAEAVVVAYVQLRALIDGFKLNNALVDRCERLALEGVQEFDNRMVKLRKQLAEYGPKLHDAHNLAMNSVELALRKLG